MLVISRNVGDKVQIGETTLTVISVGKYGVRLGFDAAREIPIFRSELIDRQAYTVERPGEWVRSCPPPARS